MILCIYIVILFVILLWNFFQVILLILYIHIYIKNVYYSKSHSDAVFSTKNIFFLNLKIHYYMHVVVIVFCHFVSLEKNESNFPDT